MDREPLPSPYVDPVSPMIVAPMTHDPLSDLTRCAVCLDSIKGNLEAGVRGCLQECEGVLSRCRGMLAAECERALLAAFGTLEDKRGVLSRSVANTLYAAGDVLSNLLTAAGETETMHPMRAESASVDPLSTAPATPLPASSFIAGSPSRLPLPWEVAEAFPAGAIGGCPPPYPKAWQPAIDKYGGIANVPPYVAAPLGIPPHCLAGYVPPPPLPGTPPGTPTPPSGVPVAPLPGPTPPGGSATYPCPTWASPTGICTVPGAVPSPPSVPIPPPGPGVILTPIPAPPAPPPGEICSPCVQSVQMVGAYACGQMNIEAWQYQTCSDPFANDLVAVLPASFHGLLRAETRVEMLSQSRSAAIARGTQRGQ